MRMTNGSTDESSNWQDLISSTTRNDLRHFFSPSSCRRKLASIVANLVAQLRGLLVFFGGDRFLHFAAQADELRLLVGAVRAALGHFADVLRLVVDVHQQRLELLLEEDVVVRAAQPPCLRNCRNVMPHTGQARWSSRASSSAVSPTARCWASSPAIAGIISDASSVRRREKRLAHSSHRCSSFGLPSIRSVM